MGRIGSMPSVPDQFRGEVQATSWWLGDTWPGVSPHPDEAGTAEAGALARRPPVARADAPLDLIARELGDPAATVVVVVDDDDRPLGVVTAAHVLRCVRRRSRAELARATALDAATSGGAFIPATTSLKIAARMLTNDERPLGVVIDEGGRLIGVLTATAMLRALALNR
ncbi:MAG: CBS domain-containing protein [Myxococcales bacterium]|nr:CBS domain-containing protein [Myxococcales bacterium]